MNTDYAVPSGAQSRDAGLLPQPSGGGISGALRDFRAHRRCPRARQLFFPDDQAKASALLVEFARHAVELGGTVSAEHGVGKRKAHLLELQYTPDQLAAMRAVKQRLDPQGLLGRGTLWT